MAGGVGLVWDLIAKDQATPGFLRVAGAADKAATATARASAGLTATVARMGKLGKNLTKHVTLPLVALAAVSVDQAAKYQKSLNTIQVATGRTTAQMTAGSKGLLQIATQTGTSVGKLTDSFYVASKSGLSVARSLAVTKAAAEAAKTENADLATVTDGLTSVMASYGKTLRNPVAAMNEIIKGAGLAKTTTQDFTASLSNVVPIASSLGISFDQVAGATATMTQHGETAQRATENLANLITNLAGQNNVASQALQQLGVNTVDLSKNLGKRGLTGSLGLVLGAIAKHGRAGLIITSAFKHAGLATASLRTELDHMPKALQVNARAFDTGKMSYKNFYAYAKSLGGQQFQLAKGFINTESQAKGFSNQLKSGNGNVRTLAATLQKALGGVTGMRTALMLSGQSADTFARSTAAVKKAASATKGDVLGWASTQNNLSVKIDKAKASLQVMAVELGTALLPAIGKLADAGAKAVHWFDGLSGTQKKVLVWSLGVVAALGPILSIGTRLALVGRGIGTFVGGVGTTLSRLAGSTTEQAARVGVAMRRMGSALAGAGVGYAIGSLTKHSSGATQAVGALTSAAAGAAIGFGVGGPWGAAIGGAAGLVSNLATNFLGASDATQKETDALAAQKQAALDLAAVLGSTAFNKQGAAVKGSAIAELTKSGAYDNKYSISPTILTSAALGSYGAIQQATNVILRANGDLGKSWNKVSSTSKDAIRTLNQQIFDATERAHQAELDYEHMSVAAGRLGFTHVKLSREVKQFGRSLDTTTAFGQRNTFVIQQQAHALAELAIKHSTSGAAAVKAAGQYTRQEDALRAAAIAAGFNKDQVEKLTARYQRLPKQVVTELKKIGVTPSDIEGLISKYGHIPKAVLTVLSKTGVTPGDIQAIIDRYNLIPASKSTTVTTVYRTQHTNDANPGTRGDQTLPSQHKAVGGTVRDGYFTVGEHGGSRGWELGHKSGSQVRFWSNADSRRKTGWDRVPGFAGGSGHPDQSTLSSTVSTAIGNVGSAPSSKFNVADVGITRISGQIRHAIAVLNAEVAKGLSKNAAAKYRHEIAAYIREANRQLGALRLKVRTSDLAALRRGLKGTVDDTRTAFQQLITDMQHIGAPIAAVKEAQQAESKLLGIQSRLASARTYRSTVMDTLRGGFDSTHYGSVTDLHQALAGQTGQNNTYATELDSLRGRSKGNKALTGYINQLAQSGQTATLETLYGSSKAELGQIGKDVGAYDKSVLAGGNAAEESKYGQSVDKMAHGQAVLAGAIAKLATAIAKSENKPAVLDAKQHKHHTDKHIEQALSELTRLLS